MKSCLIGIRSARRPFSRFSIFQPEIAIILETLKIINSWREEGLKSDLDNHHPAAVLGHRPLFGLQNFLKNFVGNESKSHSRTSPVRGPSNETMTNDMHFSVFFSLSKKGLFGEKKNSFWDKIGLHSKVYVVMIFTYITFT